MIADIHTPLNGDLIPLQVKEPYPGFGTHIPLQPGQMTTMQKVRALAIKVFPTFLFTTISFAVFASCTLIPFSPLAIAIGVSYCIFVVTVVVYKIYARCVAYRFQRILPPDIIAANTAPGAPALGHYSSADVILTNDACESFEWKKKCIENANHSIECSFNFAGGMHFQEFAEIIDKKMHDIPHFRTHLIISKDLVEKADKRLLAKLKKRYPDRFHYIISGRFYSTDGGCHSEENHVKLLVVDGAYFIIGGTGVHEQMNREECHEKKSGCSMGQALLDKCFRDQDLVGYGTISETMRSQFFNLYQLLAQRTKHMCMDGEGLYFSVPSTLHNKQHFPEFHQSPHIIPNVKLKFIVGGPEHKGYNPILRKISKRLKKAEQTANIHHMFLNPTSEVKDALSFLKTKPDVHVRGCFNSLNNGTVVSHVVYAIPSRYHYSLLDEAHEYNTPDQLFHKKTITIGSTTGGERAFIGSLNLGRKSQRDYEGLVLCKDKRVCDALHAVFQKDINRSVCVKNAHGEKKFCISKIVAPFFISLLGKFVI